MILNCNQDDNASHQGPFRTAGSAVCLYSLSQLPSYLQLYQCVPNYISPVYIENRDLGVVLATKLVWVKRQGSLMVRALGQ